MVSDWKILFETPDGQIQIQINLKQTKIFWIFTKAQNIRILNNAKSSFSFLTNIE